MPRLLTPDLEAGVVIIIIVGRCVCVKESIFLYILLALCVKDHVPLREE